MDSPQTPPQAPPQAGFAALLEAHRGIVLKVAATYCRHADDRQDLIQEIAAQLWRAYRSYDASRPFSTWMYRIALNVAISHVRDASYRERHSTTLNIDDDDHAAIAEAQTAFAEHDTRQEHDERIRALYAVIDRQAPLDRALLLLWLEERSQREIADVLGISESNVATKLGRLKQRIRRQLSNHEPQSR